LKVTESRRDRQTECRKREERRGKNRRRDRQERKVEDKKITRKSINKIPRRPGRSNEKAGSGQPAGRQPLELSPDYSTN
jgi:hypothetical protein